MVKILIVEDSPATFKQLSEACEDALKNHNRPEIVNIDNGSAALSSLEHTCDYDICICDYVLPGENGIAVANKLYQKNPDCPIIMVTSELQLEEQTRQIKSIRCWMLKPVSPLRFKDVLIRVLNQ